MARLLPKILIVDEHADHRVIYSGHLRAIQDVDILETADGQQALELAREHDFAMFLLDVNLPGIDGFELASRLRREPRSASTPIVFVTSEASERTYVMRGYRLGAVDFMVSAPVHGEILAEKCRVFLEMFRKRQELQDLADRANRESRELHERLGKFIREQERMRVHATLDTLTGLPNRALFHDRLAAALARATRNRQRFGIACIDVEGLAEIRDRLGGAAGDAALVIAAERLAQGVRATDTVARPGSDEFALLFEGIEGPAAAALIVQKAHRALTAPLTLPGAPAEEIRLGASIGVALYPDHARELEDLLVLADLTMFAVKGAGGGHRIYPGNLASGRDDEPQPPPA